MGRATRNAMKVGFTIGLLVWFLAGGFLIAAGLALMYSQKWEGGILLIPGGLLIGIGISRLKKWKREQADEVIIPETSTVKEDEEILFHWHLTPDEWRNYVKQEIRETLRTALYVLIIIPALGGVVWIFISDPLFLVMIAVITGILMLASLWGMVERMKLFQSKPEVIFKVSGLLLGDHVILYRNERAWPKEVEINDKQHPAVLVIKFEKFSMSRYTVGNKRQSANTVRVPIPQDKLEEAMLVKDLILSKRR